MMRVHLFNLALLAACLFQAQAQLSAEFIFEEQLITNEEDISTLVIPELAIPVPTNFTLPADQAAANMRDSASKLTQVGGRVAIRNLNETASVVNAQDLANDILNRSVPIGNLGSDIDVVLLNGGKVPFIYLGPSDEENLTQEASSAPIITTVEPGLAPDTPIPIPNVATVIARSIVYSASFLDSADEYVVTTSSNGTVRIVNSSDFAQEAREQADLLFAVEYLTVMMSTDVFSYRGLRELEGFPPVSAIVLKNESVFVVRQGPNSAPTLTFVNSTVAPPWLEDTIIPADEVTSSLRDSISKLSGIDGYVVTRNSIDKVNVIEASKLAKDLIRQANDYSKLGTITVTIRNGTELFEPVIRVEGFSSIDAFIVGFNMYGEEATVYLVKFNDM